MQTAWHAFGRGRTTDDLRPHAVRRRPPRRLWQAFEHQCRHQPVDGCRDGLHRCQNRGRLAVKLQQRQMLMPQTYPLFPLGVRSTPFVVINPIASFDMVSLPYTNTRDRVTYQNKSTLKVDHRKCQYLCSQCVENHCNYNKIEIKCYKSKSVQTVGPKDLSLYYCSDCLEQRFEGGCFSPNSDPDHLLYGM